MFPNLLACALLLAVICLLFLPAPIPSGVWLQPREFRALNLRRFAAIALVVGFAILIMGVSAAMAQTAETTVAPAPSPSIVVNIGAIVTYLIAWGRDIILSVLGLVVTAFVPAAYRQWITNQALEKAVDFALGAVAGAARDKVLTIPVTSTVLATAAGYVEAQFPKVADRLGDALKAALLARLSSAAFVPAEATAAQVNAPTPSAI